MSNEPVPLSAEDRWAIHELIALHGHIIDERQFSRVHEIFSQDAVYDVADFGAGIHSGIEGIRRLCMNSEDRNPLAHHVTNVVIARDTDGTVRVASKGIGILPEGKAGSVVYKDVVVKTPQGWRISRRLVLKQRPESIPKPD